MPTYPYQVVLTQGDPSLLQGDGDPTSSEGQLVLAPLPAFDLGPGCRIEVGSYNLDGSPRGQDAVYDVALSVGDLTAENV